MGDEGDVGDVGFVSVAVISPELFVFFFLFWLGS